MAYNNKRRSTSGSLFGGGAAENIGIGGRKTPFGGGGGGYRGPEEDPYIGPPDQAPNPPAGQGMQGPGSWGAGSWLASFYGQLHNQPWYQEMTGQDPWQNMGDVYDYYLDQGGNAPGFTDWWQGGGGWEAAGPWEDFGGFPSQPIYQGSGGGNIGGAGDLGTGNIFTGGGQFGEGITNPFGVGWGPEGQYEGSGDTSDIDPGTELDDECLELWNQYNSMGGASMEYSEFSSMFCG
jgi:hypothetical protein